MQEKHVIDLHKGVTALFVVSLIGWRNAWGNDTALLYLALHGSYGLLWVTKSRFFPDKSWEKPCAAPRALFIWLALSLYWIAPWLIVSGDVRAPGWLMAGAAAINIMGVFLHFSSDMQKYVALRLRPGQLVSDGLWSRLRNPNYFGELLIYLSFAMLAMHWIPYLVLAIFVFAYWIPNMLRKDRSLSRYPEFENYRERSWRFIPFVF